MFVEGDKPTGAEAPQNLSKSYTRDYIKATNGGMTSTGMCSTTVAHVYLLLGRKDACSVRQTDDCEARTGLKD